MMATELGAVRDLENELVAMRGQLQEAQVVLAAIGAGEADALVVQTESGPQVYTLKSVDQPYRTLVETLKEGAATATSNGVLLYCNDAFARLVGRKAEALVGLRLADLFGSDIVGALTSGGGATGLECSLPQADGGGDCRDCVVSSAPHYADQETVWCLLVTDVTGQATRLRYAAIVDSTDDAVMSFDGAGRIASWNPAAETLFGYTAEEAIGRDADLLIAPLPATPEGQTGLYAFKTALGGVTYRKDTQRIAKDGTVIDVSITKTSIRTRDGAIVGVSAIMHDITERKRGEEYVRLLLGEVNHRSKNMLSIIQAIAARTARSHPDDFLESFGQRIQALAASQDLLVKSGWKAVPLGDLVHSQLAPFGETRDHRVVIDGPPVAITTSASQALGMALHELATNALKYGALSNETGRVSVRWGEHTDAKGVARFTMSWVESGGPLVKRPSRQGFGSTVIGSMIEFSFGCQADIEYAPTGLLWRINCPADMVIEGRGVQPRRTDAPVRDVSGDRARILVVEDEPLNAIEITYVLDDAGFHVLGPVDSVAQALALLDSAGCDAAILDVNLGDETSEPIALRLTGMGIPFVVLSAYSRDQIPAGFATAPLVDKPFDPSLVVDGIRRCLLDRTAVQESR